MYKIIIAGGRDFKDYDLLSEFTAKVLEEKYAAGTLSSFEKIAVISGMAPGADKLGYAYGKQHGYKVIEMPAPWNAIEGKPKHQIRIRRDGKKYWVMAGKQRNTEMAQEGNMLIAFWDGISGGTEDMILKAHRHGLDVKVQLYNQKSIYASTDHR